MIPHSLLRGGLITGVALAGLLWVLAALLVPYSAVAAPGQGHDTDAILVSAESLFKAMKAGNYKNVWSLLSAGSRKTIINDSLKAIRKSGFLSDTGEQYTPESLTRDFASGGPIAKAYWDAYIEKFDPRLALEESRWTMGDIRKGEAEVLIQWRKSEGPVRLQMVREDGKWKIALMETFAYSKR